MHLVMPSYVCKRTKWRMCRFLFFALFSVVGKTSAFIGPLVSSAIIDAADGNQNMPFAFLLALSVLPPHMTSHVFGLTRKLWPRGVLSCGVLYFVDVKKSRLECREFVAAEGRREAFA